MHFYRCLICGEVYMGDGIPSHCPFCGARPVNLVPNDQWVDENKDLGELSAISVENLQKALQLEVNNAPFYVDAMNKAQNTELQGMFKYFSKIETEHASVIRKILRCDLPQPEHSKEVAVDDDLENIRAAHAREKEATRFYADAAKQAVEPRVKKVFLSLTEIESDHVKLEGSRIML